MYVVVGLGNPGKKYRDTRHNIGFNVADVLAQANNIKLNKLKFNAAYGEGFIGREKVILVKPQTYMNNSGVSVSEIMRFYKIPAEKLIVIVDDIDIEFSSIKIKPSGSAGTHNGLKSIIQHISTKEFPRIKIGIGKKHPQQDLASFVLSRFSDEEAVDIEESIKEASNAVQVILKDGISTAMNEFNKK